MKHIVLFSGGAASSYAAYLVSQKHKKEDIILLHTPTHSEDKDSDRFRKEVSNYLEIPITEESYGMNIWELIEKKNIYQDNSCHFAHKF
jgi:diphthamide synthase (EF-2-diphthine--ammonia ligase)